MTEEQFHKMMDRNELNDEYSEYIMRRSDTIICNGDDLIMAMESGDYYDDFMEEICE